MREAGIIKEYIIIGRLKIVIHAIALFFNMGET